MKFNKLLILTVLCSAASLGCNRRPAPQQTQVVYEQAKPPEGTVEDCWQEPKVTEEQNGPGVDEEGHWYSPSYKAIREVKMGKWNRCSKGVN